MKPTTPLDSSNSPTRTKLAPSSLLGTIKKAASPEPEAATPIDIKNRSQTLFDLIEMPLMPWKPDESSGKGVALKKD